MAKVIENNFRAVDGSRDATYGEVLAHVVQRIRSASAKGSVMRLSAEEVRALDWAIIREDGGYDTSRWLSGSFADVALTIPS